LKKEDVEKLEKTMGLLEGLHREMSALAKKSPNDGINTFKLRFLNSALSDANDLLGEKYNPLEGFQQFDSDDVPTNSDAAFVLTSYLEEVERMRADNIFNDYNKWTYVLSDSEDKIRTAPPKKIKEKK
tara:strand:+ start:93 stop:476 length:384 start_codon:yes stop_codon:yes gene_type:complete